jgi:hypothetical protein
MSLSHLALPPQWNAWSQESVRTFSPASMLSWHMVQV